MPPYLPPGEDLVLRDGSTTLVRCFGPVDAPPLLLIHGWWVSADLNWAYNYEKLTKHHRVVAFDLAGHGHGPRREARFSFQACVDDALQVLDYCNIDSAVVAGYSMGGCVGQLLARQHPSRVDGLVLCATGAEFRGTGSERAIFSVLPPLSRATRLAPDVAMRRAFDWGLPKRMRGGSLEAWATDQIAAGDLQTLLEAGAELYRFDSRPWAALLAAPTAVIRTMRDRTVPLERQSLLVESLDAPQIFDIDGDHAVCITRPDTFADLLLSAANAVSDSPT